MSEPLFICPLCERRNFSKRGLKAHRCPAKIVSGHNGAGRTRTPLSYSEIARAVQITPSSNPQSAIRNQQ